ncbi:hypothetical protein [Haematobacter missouriensis]|uniref:hypothetical protein n=1 Tax=Haematobacter missouriensis TaxID=366616 RepID=UPI001303E957|nr:hypothetical protein [Haematobacter missouriensis]
MAIQRAMADTFRMALMEEGDRPLPPAWPGSSRDRWAWHDRHTLSPLLSDLSHVR